MLKTLKVLWVTALTLTLTNLSQSTVQATYQFPPVRIALPTLAIVHRKNGNTQSGTIMSITNQSITIRREGQQATIQMIDIDPSKGINFDSTSLTYRCSKCDPVFRSSTSLKSKRQQDLQSINIKDFRFTDAQKGQAEIQSSTAQLQSAAKECREALCIVDSMRFDTTKEKTIYLRFTLFNLNGPL
jgi:hypothetical protein